MPTFRTRVLVLGAAYDLTVVWRRPVPVDRDEPATRRFDFVHTLGGWMEVFDWASQCVALRATGRNLSQPWWAGVAYLHVGDDPDVWVVTDSTGSDVLGVSCQFFRRHGAPVERSAVRLLDSGE